MSPKSDNTLLILYHSDQFIHELFLHLQEQNVKVTCFNIVNWTYDSNVKRIQESPLKLLKPIMKIPKLRGFLIKLFRPKLLRLISEKYSVVDIHFFSPVYDSLIEYLKRKGCKVKITIWGSDFYRVDNVRKEQQRRLYQLVDIIQVETQQIANDFLSNFAECSGKIRITHFGIGKLGILDELMKNQVRIYKTELDIPDDKVVITCGSGGSSGHRHSVMLDSISRIEQSLKNRIFLFIPMTYGGNNEYINEIREKANSMGLPYKIINTYLSEYDLCKIRIITDIFITIQITDALSSAIQEHLYTGALMISGEWLPYKILSEGGIFYFTTKLESLTDTLTDTIKNHNYYKKKTLNNKLIIGNISSWNSRIPEWIKIYNELFEIPCAKPL
jgi:hypothetical protein